MPDASNAISFSSPLLKLSASGQVTFVLAVAVSVLILAIAWRLVRR